MAIREEIDLVVRSQGMDEAIAAARQLAAANRDVADSEEEKANTMADSANAVLENGGAMGLLNDATGGYAMMAKDAVEASALLSKETKVGAALQSAYAFAVEGVTIEETKSFVKKQALAIQSEVLAVKTRLMTGEITLFSVAMKAYNFVVGLSSNVMKLFRIALIGTGIGAIVVGVIALIQNFGKLKDAVLNLFPGLKMIGAIFGGLIDAVTDFIGVTSDASRELAKLNEEASKGLKEQEVNLELNGDKYDEYTKRKMQAEIDYRNKVKELAEMDDDELSEEKRLKFMQDAHAKMLREIKQADDDSRGELDKTLADWRKKQEDANAKTNMEKLALDRKRSLAEISNIRATETEKGELRKKINAYYDGQEAAEQEKLNEEAERKKDEAIQKEKARRESIKKILDDYRKRDEDALAKTNLQKINLEEQRAIAELKGLKATREQKEEVNKYYDKLRKQEEVRLAKERVEIERSRVAALRNLEFDQRQWEIEHEADPMDKLKKQKELLKDQAQAEIDALQLVIDNQELTEKERADAQAAQALAKQNRDQEVRDNELAQLALEDEREAARLAKQKERLDELMEMRKDVVFNAAEWLDQLAHKDEQRTDEEIDRDRAVAQNRLNVGLSTTKALLDLAGKGSALSKGMAAAQAVQDTLKGANAAYSALAGIPVVGPALGAVAYAAAMAQGYGNVRKILASKNIETSAPSAGGGAAGAAVPSAPAFNLVQGTGANQIAESIANNGNTPIEAYVVSNNVTTAQGLERNAIDNGLI